MKLQQKLSDKYMIGCIHGKYSGARKIGAKGNMLIERLNIRAGNLLPRQVKNILTRTFTNQVVAGRTRAENVLLRWALDAMPAIAEYHGVPSTQVIDSIQHYRFGIVQALRLLKAGGNTNVAAQMGYEERIALFTAIHDIGRMMVGSGASKIVDFEGRLHPLDEDSTLKKAREEGNLAHPIVGALMLEEAFSPLFGIVKDDIAGLLRSLISTTERHSIAVGIQSFFVRAQRIGQLRDPRYHDKDGSLFLADDPQLHPAYHIYAHLVALADLVNNVSETISGTSSYDSLVGLEKFDIEKQIDYLIHGPGNGRFAVVKNGEEAALTVRRAWIWKDSDGKPHESNLEEYNIQDSIALMKQIVLNPFIKVGLAAQDEVADAFKRGVRRVFPGMPA